MDINETTIGSDDPSRRRLDQVNYGLACLVIVTGPMIGERFPLTKGRLVIGRRPEVEISIDDPLISRKHAEVVVKGSAEAVLRDLGSRNGTFCNNQKILEKMLKDGDLIRIGSAILKYIGPDSIEHHYLTEMSERAIRDGLTGLFNKQTFHHHLERNLVRCKELHEPISLALIDFDWFKKINDGWGHPAGDYVLKEFAGLITNRVRPTDFVARYGGEEFALILPYTHLKDAERLTERIRVRAAEHPFVFNGQKLPVTLSIGIAEWGGVESADTLIAHADKALYQAKQEGRNRLCCYTGTV